MDGVRCNFQQKIEKVRIRLVFKRLLLIKYLFPPKIN